MNVVIITQNDPFYLSDNLNYLLNNLPSRAHICGCVLFKASPFGEKKSFIGKISSTISIFGVAFFIHYAFRYCLKKFFSLTPKKVLQKHKIPIIDLPNNINHTNSIDQIKSFKPDLLVSILGNQIFKDRIINLAHKGCLNLHTALLPKYRGLMPSFWVLKNNEKETGVSVFYVDEGIDSGPIIVQKKFDIDERSQADLIKYSKKIGMDAIIEAIDLIINDSVNLIPNPDNEKTYFSFPSREDVLEFKRIGKKFF